GPVWFADHQCLYVSDLPGDRILRWSEAAGVTEFRKPSHYANGHARDRQGRLISCSHGLRAVTRTELDGTVTVLADHHQGKQLNSPNDLVCASDGTIWFTDPPYGGQTDYEGGKHDCERPPTLYRLDAGTGALSVAADDIAGPNGLAFSPDERWLYVADTGENFAKDSNACIRRFAVGPDLRLSGGDPFHTISPGKADGLRVDDAGNIWSSAADGVHCIAPDGTLMGKILTPWPVSNLCFGGRHTARLFLCASHTLMAIYVNVRGCVLP
ncbi:MAG: SMP-30/gluconolactonase/LRE family protein, partial [Pseudomonadota bacterium]|nr:SMP-30/gluconolactonase/LRE family protein [Pseudomonadota bacterium]